MKCFSKLFLLITLISIAVPKVLLAATKSAEEHRHHGAHVHGEAKLTLAFDGETKLDVVFESPGDSIVGFEHEAKSKKDRATLEKILTRLKSNSLHWLVSKDLDSCSVENPVAKFEREAGEDHSEIHFSYKIVCSKKIESLNTTASLFSEFKKLGKIRVNVLTSSGQKEFLLTDAKDSFSINQ